MVTHSKDVNRNLQLTTKLSYYDLEYLQDRDNDWGTTTFYTEEEYLAGIGANWTPHENHKLYLGYDYSRLNLAVPDPYWDLYWSIDMHSLISEYQWYMGDRFTFIAGSRFEKHSSIDHMLISPRAALIFRQNNDRTFKLLYNHSIRRTDEEVQYKYEEQESESIDYYELIYHQLINESLSFQLSAYYALHDLIDFSATLSASRPIGQTEFTGFDWEWHYVTDKWRTLLSLSYCKLLNLDLLDPTGVNFISAEPQGFGDDFAEVPNWIIKAHSQYKFNNKLNFTGSIVSHLGVDGRRDLFEGLFGQEVSAKIDDPILLLSLGADYQLSKSVKARVDAHNILGWVDRDLNNRFNRSFNEYRPDVASLSIGVQYAF
jgi:hypothetical protein